MQTMVLSAGTRTGVAREPNGFLVQIATIVVLLVTGGLIANSDTFRFADSAPAASNVIEGAYVVPSSATEGILAISIPPGTADRMRAGDTGYILPNVIQLHVGEKIVITNNDYLPHMMLFDFIEPGETIERTFDQITLETYSAGCTMDPTPSGFTSLFVSE